MARMVTVAWCFNEHGVRSVALFMADGIHNLADTLVIQPCPIDSHPGSVSIEVVDADGDGDLAGHVREWLSFASDLHDCLPSPICEVCGAEAGSAERAMENAVMRGRLGED